MSNPTTSFRNMWRCGWLLGFSVTSNSGTKMLSSISWKLARRPCSLYTW